MATKNFPIFKKGPAVLKTAGPGSWKSLLVVHREHIGDQLHHLVGVAGFVVVPGDDLDKVVGQAEAGLLVEDGAHLR